MINPMGGNNRMLGLFSGLETDKLVQTLMMRNFTKFNRISQQRQLAEWRVAAYQGVNAQLRGFREEFGSALSRINMASRNTFNTNTVTMSDNPFVTITANSTARLGNHRIDRIDQLAEAAQIRSRSLTSASNSSDIPANFSRGVNTRVSDLTGSTSEVAKITINGKELEFAADMTMTQVINTINNERIGVTASFSQLDNTITLATTTTGADQKLTIGAAANSTAGAAMLNHLFGGAEVDNDRVQRSQVWGSAQFVSTAPVIDTLTGDPEDDRAVALATKLVELPAGERATIRIAHPNGSGVYIIQGKTVGEIIDDINLTTNISGIRAELNNDFELVIRTVDPGFNQSIQIFDMEGTFAADTFANANVKMEPAEPARFTSHLPRTGTATIRSIAGNSNMDAAATVGIIINNETMFFSATDTLNTVMNRINSVFQPDPEGATASFRDGRFHISSKENGLDAEITIAATGDGGQAFLRGLFAQDFFGASTTTVKKDGADALHATGQSVGFIAEGQDAKLQVNGIPVERSTNTFTADGITYNLRAATHNPDGTPVSTAGTNVNLPLTFAVSRNVQNTIDNIREMVNAFNTLVENLTTMLTTRPNRAFPPLTEHQRQNMTREEIEKWEAEAMMGALHRDPTLQRVLTDLRSSLSMNIPGGGTLASIGIATPRGVGDFKLEINEVTLRRALEEDPDRVATIFTAAASTDENGRTTMGFMPNALAAIDRFHKTTHEVHIHSLNRSIQDFANQMVSERARLDRREAQLFARFTAMERMLSGLNSQAGWLNQQMGGM